MSVVIIKIIGNKKRSAFIFFHPEGTPYNVENRENCSPTLYYGDPPE